MQKFGLCSTSMSRLAAIIGKAGTLTQKFGLCDGRRDDKTVDTPTQRFVICDMMPTVSVRVGRRAGTLTQKFAICDL
jgi:hypothetical protein